MKGMELPINTLIILVIAMVILIALIALFYGVWGPGVSDVNLESAKNNACQKLLSMNCGVNTYNVLINDFDANKDGSIIPAADGGYPDTCGTNDNLAELCRCYYNLGEDECEHDLCKCPQ